MTLAHELGHGVHQLLSAEQGYLLADTPLTVAETASVFGEMLTFQSLLRKTTTPQQKMRLLAGKVEDMLNTVVRQIAFHLFEAEVHTRRQDHELSPQELSETWIGVQQESLGDAFVFDDSYKQYWSYIPHFIHSPFYVYAYAFGDCLVNSLYAVYEQQPDGFAAKYLALLKAGGSKDCVELLKPFNLNPLDPTFWQQGLRVVERFIDEVEALTWLSAGH
jgi:oligoendopeptidase F